MVAIPERQENRLLSGFDKEISFVIEDKTLIKLWNITKSVHVKSKS